MKIAYLYPRYLTNDGGAEVGLTRIVEELARRGHEITVIAASPLASDRSFERKPRGCRVVALPRSVWRERALQFLDSIQYRRGGYRLTRFLARKGQLWRKLLLLGKGACCPSLGRRSLYEPYDLVVNYCTTHTSWGIAFDEVLPRLKDKAVCAVTMSATPSVRMEITDPQSRKNRSGAESFFSRSRRMMPRCLRRWRNSLKISRAQRRMKQPAPYSYFL